MALDSKSTEQLLAKINEDDTISKENKDLATGVLKVIRGLREERERLDSQCFGKISENRELLKLQKRDFLDEMCRLVEESIEESHQIPGKQTIQGYPQVALEKVQQQDRHMVSLDDILSRKKMRFLKSTIANLLDGLIKAAPDQDVLLHNAAPQNKK